MGVKLWVKPYVAAAATPALAEELQGNDVLIDSDKLRDPKERKRIITDFLAGLKSKGDKWPNYSGRPEWSDYAGLKISKIPKQRLSRQDLARLRRSVIVREVTEAPTEEEELRDEARARRRVRIVLKGRPYARWEIGLVTSKLKAKDIAERTGRTPHAIWQKRYRIRKKAKP
jgi:hypothetical protein